MRPEWRLAISNASARPSRTLLLVGAVLLSAAMIAAVSCAMASITKAVGVQLDQSVGRAELRLKSAGRNATMPASVLDTVRGWPQAAMVTGRVSGSLTLLFERTAWVKGPGGEGFGFRRVECVGTAMGTGIDPELEPTFRAMRLVAGRLPRAPDEIAIDEAMVKGFGEVDGTGVRVLGETDPPQGEPVPASTVAAALANRGSAPGVGSEVRSFRLLRSPVPLKVVGVVARPPLGGRWQT